MEIGKGGRQRHAAAMEKIAALVSVRERTFKELRSRLDKLGFAQAEIDGALEAAQRVGLVDEERYARAYIRSKTHAGWGRRKIVAKLRESGISDTLLEACSDEFPNGEAELELALGELARRGTRSSNPYAALVRRLVGKGFSPDVARQAVRLHLAREDAVS